MIKKDKFLEIQRLLQEGKTSQRKIALQIGVSRTAVKAVFFKLLVQTEQDCNESSSTGSEKRIREIIHPGGSPRRCPHCGRLVKMPCLACQLYDIRRQRFERP